MPNRKDSSSQPPRSPADDAARATDTAYSRSDSGPAHPPGSDNQPTEQVQKAAAVAAMAARMPYNPTKPGEHGRYTANKPQPVATSPPPKLEAKGSTLLSTTSNI